MNTRLRFPRWSDANVLASHPCGSRSNLLGDMNLFIHLNFNLIEIKYLYMIYLSCSLSRLEPTSPERALHIRA